MQRLSVSKWLKTAISKLLRWSSTPELTSPRLESGPKSPPTETLSAHQLKQRAATAQQLLENPVLIEAVAAEEARILNQMRQCGLRDQEMHTRLIMALQMSSAVTRNLWQFIQAGNAAPLNIRGSRID